MPRLPGSTSISYRFVSMRARGHSISRLPLPRSRRNRRLTSASLDVDFGHDPVGHLARTGVLPPGRGLAETHKLLRGAGFAGHLFSPMGGLITKQARGKRKNLGA